MINVKNVLKPITSQASGARNYISFPSYAQGLFKTHACHPRGFLFNKQAWRAHNWLRVMTVPNPISFQRRKVPNGLPGICACSARTSSGDTLYRRETELRNKNKETRRRNILTFCAFSTQKNLRNSQIYLCVFNCFQTFFWNYANQLPPFS